MRIDPGKRMVMLSPGPNQFGCSEAAGRAAQDCPCYRVLAYCCVDNRDPEGGLDCVWWEIESSTKLVRVHRRKNHGLLANICHTQVCDNLAIHRVLDAVQSCDRKAQRRRRLVTAGCSPATVELV